MSEQGSRPLLEDTPIDRARLFDVLEQLLLGDGIVLFDEKGPEAGAATIAASWAAIMVEILRHRPEDGP